jgi:hypothetical protein
VALVTTEERSARYLRLLMWLLVPAAFFNGFDGELRALLLPQLRLLRLFPLQCLLWPRSLARLLLAHLLQHLLPHLPRPLLLPLSLPLLSPRRS